MELFDVGTEGGRGIDKIHIYWVGGDTINQEGIIIYPEAASRFGMTLIVVFIGKVPLEMLTKQLEIHIWVTEDRTRHVDLETVGLKVIVEAVGWLSFLCEEGAEHRIVGKAFTE